MDTVHHVEMHYIPDAGYNVLIDTFNVMLMTIILMMHDVMLINYLFM